VVEELGNGGFGQVCLLAEINTGNVYAAKRFKNQKNIAGIKHEIATLKKLSYVSKPQNKINIAEKLIPVFFFFDQPNIVRFNESITEPDGSVYLIMEHVPFGDLEKRDTLKISVALEVLVQCLEGLAYLHDAGIAHRDIKPSNIVMQSDFPVCVKIVDFGLAMESHLFKTPCTTFIFQAPEILAGNSTTTMWSTYGLSALLCCTFWEGSRMMNLAVSTRRSRRGNSISTSTQCTGHASRFNRRSTVVQPKDPWSARKCLQEIKKIQRAFSQAWSGSARCTCKRASNCT
jgi:serine/threonine protein kinase